MQSLYQRLNSISLPCACLYALAIGAGAVCSGHALQSSHMAATIFSDHNEQ